MALCLVLGLSGAFAEEKDLLDTVLARGTLIVGTEGTYAPNSYYDEEGTLVGFDVEVAAAIAEKLGVKVEYYVNTWSALFMGMDNGQCDTVINEVEATEERKLKYDFSAPYTYIHGALLVAEQLGIAPADFLYLGDTKVDMTCACSAGMNPVGVLWGFRTAQELLDTGAMVLIAHTMELLEKFNL